MNYDLEQKILFVGAEKVGKTFIADKLAGRSADYLYLPTTGIDARTENSVTDDYNLVKSVIMDFAGSDRYEYLLQPYLKDANTLCITFDPWNRSSFDKAKSLCKNTKKNMSRYLISTILLIANNPDQKLQSTKVVLDKEVQKFVEEQEIEYFDLSSEEPNQRLNELRTYLLKTKPSSESSNPSGMESSTIKDKYHTATQAIYDLNAIDAEKYSTKASSSIKNIIDKLEKVLSAGPENFNKSEYDKLFSEDLKVLKWQASSILSTVLNAITSIALIFMKETRASNLAKNGDSYLFWTFGEKQKAKVAINKTDELLEDCPRVSPVYISV
ncbi:MAG: ADP-ribosylation factor-like protein [Legionellaceae bacterium]|nr:ADP-ribosylation factor-like protein [Legionellaceae bacterium]